MILKKKRSSFSVGKINNYLFIFLFTLAVLLLSVPSVYFVAKIFDEPYSKFLFILSLIVPILIAPPVIYKIIGMLNRLSHFQNRLNQTIEENKKKELMLYEQARFAFMGEMLSNISHQWRQPLNTINLAIFSAKTEATHNNLSDKQLEKTFELIETNAHYLSNTIDDFKSFFQKKDTNELRSLESIFHEIDSVVSPILKYNSIELNIDLKNAKNEKIASPLSQVILNLIGNSIDALKVSKVTHKEITIKCNKTANKLEIVCCDNGAGIDESIKNKIFDPYFTTKDKSQGTGIGLYMSRQIIEKIFSGELELTSSDQGIGACFKISIPLKKDGIST